MPLIDALEQALWQALRRMTRSPIGLAVEAIGEDDGLLPEEEPLISGAVERRRREFSAGRRCAHQALGALGCPLRSILMGQWHEPIWPPGFAGSITHDGRFAAALAYPSVLGLVWLSIDLIDQPDREIYRSIADTIAHPADTPASADDPLFVARLFSAKEVAIKILSPRLKRFIDFRHLLALRMTEGFRVLAPAADLVIAVRSFELDDVIISIGLAVDP